MFGDKITQSVAEAVKQILATEKLHPNQQKLDVHEPEKDKLTKKDFEMLRSNKKPKNEAFDPLKHVKNPSPAVKTAAKDVKRGSYADRAALMKAGGVKDDRGPRGVTKEEVEELNETPAWTRKEGKNPEGGLNRKGIASYRAEHPGSKLSMAVTTPPSKLKAGSKAANRRKSFCARMSGMEGPMKKPNGEPTRKALSLRKWNC